MRVRRLQFLRFDAQFAPFLLSVEIPRDLLIPALKRKNKIYTRARCKQHVADTREREPQQKSDISLSQGVQTI